MQDRFRRMSCYLLAGGQKSSKIDLSNESDLSNLEKSYRSYAKLFERVKLVIKKDQATEHYLNYPYVCDETDKSAAVVGVATALKDASTETVFIGSTEISDFPLEKAFNLVKKYNGEPFLGYRDEATGENPYLFGIYRKDLFEQIQSEIGSGSLKLSTLLEHKATLLTA